MKKSLLLALFSCLTFISSYSQTPAYLPTNDLVAWYPFNGNANDMSGNGHDGLVNGATLTTDRFGNANSAYSFDGVNDQIKAAQSLDFEISGNRTLSVWIYSNGLPATDQVIAGYIGTSGPWAGHAGYLMVYRNSFVGNVIGAMENDWPNGNIGWAYTNLTVFPNNWKHLVLLRENGVTYIYLNGVLQSGLTVTSPSFQNGEFVIGQSGPSIQYFDGIIDDVALWNRALTSQEISDIFTGTLHVGIDNTPDNSFVIYPNPAANEFFVKFQNNNQNNPVSIELYDMSGKLIESQLITNNISNSYKFNISNFPEGTYLTKVLFENGESLNKILNILK